MHIDGIVRHRRKRFCAVSTSIRSDCEPVFAAIVDATFQPPARLVWSIRTLAAVRDIFLSAASGRTGGGASLRLLGLRGIRWHARARRPGTVRPPAVPAMPDERAEHRWGEGYGVRGLQVEGRQLSVAQVAPCLWFQGRSDHRGSCEETCIYRLCERDERVAGLVRCWLGAR